MIVNSRDRCDHFQEGVHSLHGLFPLYKQQKANLHICIIANIWSKDSILKAREYISQKPTSDFNFVLASCRLHTAIYIAI